MSNNLQLFSTDDGVFQERLKKSDRLLRLFEDIHNYIYANEGYSAQQAFQAMLDILFTKIFDERRNSKKSQFFITQEEIDSLVNGRGSKTFEARFFDLKQEAFHYFANLIESDKDVHLQPATLGFIVSKLQSTNLSESSRDVKGLAFQKFVYAKQRNDRGQFFTPERVVELCVEFLKPQKNERIVDPACGSAGFLSQAMKYVYNHSLVSSPDREKRQYVEQNLFGIEINHTAAKLAKMRMILDGDGYANIIKADSLADWDVLNAEINRVGLEKKINYEGFFDIVLTNPPFGSQGRISNQAYLRRYCLGHRWAHSENGYVMTEELQTGQVPDLLFIERCLDLLKPGGRMAMILPNGDLENSSLEYIRHFLQERAHVLSVVHLPFETFIPFGTGVKASALFLRKIESVKNQSKKAPSIFFGKIEKIGYKGNKNGSQIYKKNSQGGLVIAKSGEPEVDEDVTEIIAAYSAFRDGTLIRETEKYFTLPAADIDSRLDFDYYKPSYRNLRKLLLKKGAKKLNEVAHIVKRKSPVLRQKDAMVHYVELADINVEYLEISSATQLFVHELPSRASYVLRKGDIITAVAGNSIGTRKHMSALVSSAYDGSICTNGFRILEPVSGVDPYYLLYFLTTDYFLNQVYQLRTGAAIPSISDEDLLSIYVFVPDQATQKKIAARVKESFQLRQKSKELLQFAEIPGFASSKSPVLSERSTVLA